MDKELVDKIEALSKKGKFWKLWDAIGEEQNVR